MKKKSIQHWMVRSRSGAMAVLLTVALLLLSACVALPDPSTMHSPPTESVVQLSNQSAIENMRGLLGRQLYIAPSTIEVITAEAMEWPNFCLGISGPTEPCEPIITPGHKMTFRVNGQEYVFHTDREAYRYRVATAPEPKIGEILMAWGGTFDYGDCMEAIIGPGGVAFGMCGGRPKIGGQFASEARLDVLNEWAATYTSFDAETDFGSVRLVGSGSVVPDEDEVRMIGRWAQMVAMEAAVGESRASMSYHGPAEIGSPDTAKCASLLIGTPIDVGIGTCDDTLRTVDLGERAYEEWIYLRNHFAPFIYETETEKVIFEGMGSESGEPWQRAILAWARGRHAELATGKTGATINTILSWHLGQDYTQKNICAHLTVLDYGYAYAEERLCEGLDLVNSSGDWLTSDELALLDTWLYTRAPLYSDNNYIDGRGTKEMSEAELADVNGWTMNAWLRIKGANSAATLGSTANTCPEATANLGMVRDYRRGFCLLVPSTHTVFETNLTEIAIVKESLLNTTDPRLHIAVLGADGRSANEFADEIIASMHGFEIARDTVEIAGQEAVVLDNVPGQDINRRVLIVYNDRLYDLTFTPMNSAEMEAFYATVVAHLVLLETEA